jgi:hypothetical protein
LVKDIFKAADGLWANDFMSENTQENIQNIQDIIGQVDIFFENLSEYRQKLFSDNITRSEKFFSESKEYNQQFIQPNIAKIDSFLKEYSFLFSVTHQTNQILERALAPRFSVFNYFSSDEMVISYIISDLLNPNGSHGQGILFLELFINILNNELSKLDNNNDKLLSINDLDKTAVATEEATYTLSNSQRRVDITLKNTDWAIGIENKPWTWEQPDQLKDYRTHLERAYPNRPCHIIFLSGSCAKATTDRERALTIHLGYRWSPEICGLDTERVHLNHWLKECHNTCKVEKIRVFLDDFINWIDRSFQYYSDNLAHGAVYAS